MCIYIIAPRNIHTYVCMYMYVCMYVYIYIYTYVKREGEGEGEREREREYDEETAASGFSSGGRTQTPPGPHSRQTTAPKSLSPPSTTFANYLGKS